jgi:hypothetical protein
VLIADNFDWPALADRYGILGVILVLVLTTGYKRVWVWGYQLRDAEKREADWKDLALRGTLIAERVTKGTTRASVEERLAALEDDG